LIKYLIYSSLFFFSFQLFSQKIERDTIIDDFIIAKNDSLMFPLDEVIVFARRKFDSKSERKYYYWYYKKVHNAYPFAKMASEKLTVLNSDLSNIKSKRKRRKHIKKIQKYLEGEFTDELKKLTKTEGRVLIKLIHRQTGITMYELIKEYRSSWKAFWYNSTAKFFKLSLKSKYQPETLPMDFLIEDILQRSFANGSLEKQESKLPIDYFDLLSEWKNIEIKKIIDDYFDKY